MARTKAGSSEYSLADMSAEMMDNYSVGMKVWMRVVRKGSDSVGK
jgi:hypothetical protein